MSDPKILLAFDFDDVQTAYALAEQLNPRLCRIKIGKALFTRAGVTVVERLQAGGFEIFLDLKYHDIPNTVADAVRAAADLGVWMVNVHASGGRKMLTAAAEALAQRHQAPLLIAVTVLTSMAEAELDDIGVTRGLAEQVAALTALSYDCGLQGVVCSAHEAAAVKAATARDFLTVTPGIRPFGSASDDQSRIMTPERALASGSDYLVIGRPITAAADPLAALESIAADIAHFNKEKS